MSTSVLGSISIPLYKDSEKYVSDKVKIGIPLTEVDLDTINEDISSEFTSMSDNDKIKEYVSNKYHIPYDDIIDVDYPKIKINGI